MTLPALATVEGLDARGADVSDVARAQAAIADASAIIHAETSNRWVTSGGELDPLMPDVVVAVAYKVIRRALQNPDGVQSEQAGPFQTTYFAGDVYLSTSEKELLHDSDGRSVSGLSSVRLTAPWPVHHRALDDFDTDGDAFYTGS